MRETTGRRRVLLKLSGEAFGGGQLGVNPDVVGQIAREIAAAFDLRGDAELAFLDSVAAVESRRRRELREAETAARAKRREEVQRLRAWERSLVEFRALPNLLGATEKEVLRWIGAGLIPVARRIPRDKLRLLIAIVGFGMTAIFFWRLIQGA